MLIPFVFFIFLGLVSCDPLACPSQEDIFPCSCKIPAFGLRIICADFNSASKLLRAFKNLRNYKVHTVLLHGLNLNDTLPADLFDQVQIKQISVENSTLRFNEPAFTGLDTSLCVLNVAANTLIKCKDGFSLAKLTKLTDLNIQKISVKKVEDNWLNDKIPNVHTITLDHNEITELGGRAFADLPLLRSVSLSDNRLMSVERSMFPQPSSQLQSLDLSSNVIRTLPHDFFSDMPVIKKVILSGNDLATLHEATWMPVWDKLDVLYLLGNKFVCDEKMKWLKAYRGPNKFEGCCLKPKDVERKSILSVYK